MTAQQFQKEHSGELLKFVQSPFGQNLLSVLGAMRPPYTFPAQDHLLAENRGAMRGYELCLRNILGLTVPYVESREPEANYGVKNTNPEEMTPKQ